MIENKALFDRNNLDDRYVNLSNKTYEKQIDAIDQGEYEIYFKYYIFGKKWLGFRGILTSLIYMWLYNVFLNKIIDKFFCVIEKAIYTCNITKVKKKIITKKLKKGYYLYTKKITKKAMLKDEKLLKKLHECDHKMINKNNGKIYKNFVQCKKQQEVSNKLHFIEFQTHFYYDIVANFIDKNVVDFNTPMLYRASHCGLLNRIASPIKENNGLMIFEHEGVTKKRHVDGGVRENGLHYGYFNNLQYFDGNIFALELPIELTPKGIQEALSYAEIDNAEAGLNIFNASMYKLHNVGKPMSTICPVITNDMTQRQIKKAMQKRRYYKRWAKILAKRDIPGSQYCTEVMLNILFKKIYPLRNNKNYVKYCGWTEDDWDMLIATLVPTDANWARFPLIAFLNTSAYKSKSFADNMFVLCK